MQPRLRTQLTRPQRSDIAEATGTVPAGAGNSTDPIFFSFPVTRVEKSTEAGDDAVYMYGKATGDDLDLDGQIIDKDFAREAIKGWFTTGANVRSMHSKALHPAGKGVELEEKDDGFYVKSRISEPVAMKLALDGVYSYYSVGIGGGVQIVKDASARNGRIVGGSMVELSLVDRGANATCRASVLKMAADGVLEEVGGTETLRTQMTELTPEVTKADDEADDCGTCDGSGKIMDGNRKCPDCKGTGNKNATPEMIKAVEARETIEDLASTVTDVAEALKVLGADVEKGDPDLSDEAREQAAKDGKALPDGSYPTRNKVEFEKAVKAYGRSGDKAATKAYLIKRAKAEGWTDLLPADWDTSGSAKKSVDSMPLLAKQIHDATCPGHSHAAAEAMHPTLAKNGVAMTAGPQARQLFWSMLQSEVDEDGGTGSGCFDISNVARAYCDVCCFITGYLQQEAWQIAMESGDNAVLASAHAELRKLAGTADETDDLAIEKGGRDFYTNAAKDQMTAAMRSMHDSIAGMWPDVCDAGMHGDAAPTPEAAPVHPLGTQHTPAAQAVIAEVTDTTEYVRASAIPELVKAALAENDDATTTKFAEELAARDKTIADLTATVEKLAAAPDPNEAPVRGRVRLTTDTGVEKAAPPEAETDLEYLESIVKNGARPELRLAAQAELTKRRALATTTGQ